MNLSRRGFLRAAGITTASIWIPQLWTPSTEIRSVTEAHMQGEAWYVVEWIDEVGEILGFDETTRVVTFLPR